MEFVGGERKADQLAERLQRPLPEPGEPSRRDSDSGVS